MKKKKKGLIYIIFLIVIILVIGLVFIFKANESSKLEKSYSTMAKDYFNNYMSVGTGANAYKVSLKMLNESNDEGLTDYDLSSFDSCNKDRTYAMVSFDYKTGKAVKTEVTLKCKN